MKKLILGLIVAVFVTVPMFGQGGIAPYAGAPQCAVHDNKAWHSLWNSVDGCHYDHQHGDNPHSADDLFGTSLYSLMGNTDGPGHIRQTFSTAGMENDVKHAGYFWQVKRNIPPTVQPNGVTQTRWITDFRVLAHQHPRLDAAVQFHSGVFEARVYDQNLGYGFIQIPGMWIDFGELVLNGQPNIVIPDHQHAIGAHKQHGTSGTPQIIWYGASHSGEFDRNNRMIRGFVSISTSVHDAWTHTLSGGGTGPFACLNPFATTCRSNATLLRPHLIMVNNFPATVRAVVDADGNGVANWSGFTNRYGVPTECAVGSNSLDCVPVTLSNVAVSGEGYVCDGPACGSGFKEHDIMFGNRTSGFSKPVN
jgi:hypothetical protein